MNEDTMRVARDWNQVENGRAKPEAIELWDAINQVVAASGGSTSCTSVARQQAVVCVHRAVTAIVEAAITREPPVDPSGPPTDEEIEAAIVAASDANFAVGEWNRDDDEPFDEVAQVANGANQELRKLFERLRGQVKEKREQLAELQATAAATFLERDVLRERLRRYRELDAAMANARLCELRGAVEKNVDPADGQVALLEQFDRLIDATTAKPRPVVTDGSNLYHVKDNDRPMFVLADSWGEAVAAYEAMVRRENDMAPDEEVEILGVDFVANRRDILVAPIDVEANR